MGIYIAMVQAGMPWPFSPRLIAAHAHIMLYGFVILMIMGVATWMFPRPAQAGGYSPEIAAAVYWIATAGTIARGIADIGTGFSDWELWWWGSVAGGMAQGLAGLLFVINIWGRIRPLGSAIREAKGEKF